MTPKRIHNTPEYAHPTPPGQGPAPRRHLRGPLLPRQGAPRQQLHHHLCAAHGGREGQVDHAGGGAAVQRGL